MAASYCKPYLARGFCKRNSDVLNHVWRRFPNPYYDGRNAGNGKKYQFCIKEIKT